MPNKFFPLGRGEEMSEGEYQAAVEMDQESVAPPPHRKRSANKHVWTTKDGLQIRITAMEDSHLVNAIKMLRRKAAAGQAQEILEATSLLTTIHGDVASDMFDMELRGLEQMSPAEWLESRVPQYIPMLREARRRKLKEVQVEIEEGDLS